MLKKDNQIAKKTLKVLACFSVIVGQLLPIALLICEATGVGNLNKAYKVNAVLLAIVFLSMFVMGFTVEEQEESKKSKFYTGTLYNIGLFTSSVLIPVVSLCLDIFNPTKNVSPTLDKVSVYGTALLLTISCALLISKIVKFCYYYFTDKEDCYENPHKGQGNKITFIQDVEECCSNMLEKVAKA